MKKKINKSNRWHKKKAVVLTIIVALVMFTLIGGVLLFSVAKVRYYNEAANQAGLVQVRELILLSVRGAKKDAPIDARTGDVYFPESKLYLPNPGTALPLTYLYDKGDVTNSQGELSISTYPVRGTEALYIARTQENLFAAVPKLQSCSRGIKLVYQKFADNDMENELRHTILLNNGKELYIYLEKDCPELKETADLFKNLRVY
jgi:hypothetical protein